MSENSTSEKLTDWEVVLGVIKDSRPQRLTLHALGSILGRTDLMALAQELKDSGKVCTIICGTVCSPVFYLKTMAGKSGMPWGSDDTVWDTWKYNANGASSLKQFLELFPFPSVRGFSKLGNGGYWTGGQWGKGQYVNRTNAMQYPFEKHDFTYAQKLIDALKSHGYTPGITKEDLVDVIDLKK